MEEEGSTSQPDDLMSCCQEFQAEKAESGGETDDNSQEEETNQFLSLISKAERKNQRRVARKEKINFNKTNWRDVRLEDQDEESTTDTEDEDDPNETRRFLSMMKQSRGTKPSPSKVVNIRWVDGKVAITPLGSGLGDLTITRLAPGQATTQERPRRELSDTVTVTRVPAQEEEEVSRRQELERRRREHRANKTEEQINRTGGKGKRKFEERMTLTEAKIGDFQDSRDYVDFLQSKLQGINIKIVK